MFIEGITVGILIAIVTMFVIQQTLGGDKAAIVIGSFTFLFSLIIFSIGIGMENSSVKNKLKMMQYDAEFTYLTIRDRHKWNRFIIENKDNWIVKDTSDNKLFNVEIKEICNEK